jgi:tetratricopeptide (TPR) repeat protein
MKHKLSRVFGIFFSVSLFSLAVCSNAVSAQIKETCGQKKADKLLQQGQAAYDKKDYQQALSFFGEAEKSAPKCSVPFFYKGMVFIDTEKNDEAIIAFQEALKRNFDESFRLHYGICQARFSQQRYEEAIKSCEESARLNDKFYWTFQNLAYLYGNLGISDKSMAAVHRALALNPRSVDMLIFKARLLFDEKKNEEAIAILTEAIKIKPDNEEAYLVLGYHYSLLTKYDEALKAAERAYEVKPKSFEVINFKAAALNELGRQNEALPLANEAVRMQPNNERALFVLGVTHFNLKNYAQAIEHFSQAVKIKPDFFEAWLLLSSAHVQNSSNWEKGEIAATQALRLRPDDVRANYQLGMMQMTNGKLELSLKSFDAVIGKKGLFSIPAAVYKGFALIALKRQREAEIAFDQAFTLKPGEKTDYAALSEVYMYRWELDKAREQMRKVIDLSATDEDAAGYSDLSWIYILSGDGQQAIAAANEAVQQNPKAYYGYTNRCRAYIETNLPDLAIIDCQKALGLRPTNGEVLFYLGRSYALKKDAALEKTYNQKAIAALEKRLNLSFRSTKPAVIPNVSNNSTTEQEEGAVSISSPSYNYYLYLLASAYFLDNDFEAAIRAYEKVIELRPRFPRLRYNLAVSYLRLNRPNLANAVAQYQMLLKLDPKLAGNLKKAIDGFKKRK